MEKKYKRYAERFAEMLSEFGLCNYEIKFYTPEDKGYEKAEEDTVFSVKVNYPYRDIRFHVHKNSLKFKKRDIEKYLIHEVMHVLLWKITELSAERFINEKQIDEEAENLCDHLAEIIFRLKT